MNTSQERDFLERVLRGDTHAINFCLMLFTMSQVMDDLIDKDKPVGDLDIIRSYHIALIALPENPFYRQHFDYLRPMLALVLQAYSDSVLLEKKGSTHGLHLAFVMRDRLTDIVTQCARLIGGWEYAQTVAMDIQLFFQDETLAEFINERCAVSAIVNSLDINNANIATDEEGLA